MVGDLLGRKWIRPAEKYFWVSSCLLFFPGRKLEMGGELDAMCLNYCNVVFVACFLLIVCYSLFIYCSLFTVD